MLISNLHDKNSYVIHITNLKKALNHGLVWENVHRVIKFNQKDWLESYINMNTKLKKNQRNNFQKEFFKLVYNLIFGETMENVRKHRNVKLVTTKERINQLVSKPNYHATKFIY